MQQGHEVRVVTYDRGYTALQGQYICQLVEGLHIVSVDNRVRVWKTIVHNLSRAKSAIASNREVSRLFDEFSPDCVITDFEPVTAWIAKLRGLPLISLDNQHRIRYMDHPVPARLMFDLWTTRLIIALMIPGPDVALATTLVMGKVTNNRTFLFPPILRTDLAAKPVSDAGFHLVYLTNGYDSLVRILHQFRNERFRVYGQRECGTDRNVEFCEHDPDAFVSDLAACRSVIATSGFTLISESMYLGKPYLALPLSGQFEQQLNALCLVDSGFGISAENASVTVLADFLHQLPQIRRHIRNQRSASTFLAKPSAVSLISEKLDEILADLTSVKPVRSQA